MEILKEQSLKFLLSSKYNLCYAIYVYKELYNIVVLLLFCKFPGLPEK